MADKHTIRNGKLAKVRQAFGAGKVISAERTVELLETVIQPGDRIIHEGDNQKQGDFLAGQLARMNPEKVHDLRLCVSSVGLSEHLDLFENGLANQLDFAYAAPQAARLARMVMDGSVKIGDVHTYVELYSRYFAELRPDIVCLVANEADKEGNLYTGPNTEETPPLAESGAFGGAIVIVQVNKIVDQVCRVDIPAQWIDFVIESPKPFHLEPLFTRDPALIYELRILMAMIAMKAIYAKYNPKVLNHGIGFNTAAIELLLPTYGEELGLKGKACTHWALNPHPTMIPAIESGFVEAISCFGGEVGMEEYVSSRPDVFALGRDGSLRSNRFFAQMVGHHADMFVGATLQIDSQGHSSTFTADRLVGYGGAPNLGSENRSRRHRSEAFLKAGAEAHAGEPMPQGRKLVVQIVETFQAANKPTFVERLEAWDAMEKAGFPTPPVMIYGDDISHIVTEEGVANLLLCKTPEEREQAVRGVAGFTPVGLKRDRRMVENLRDRGVIQRAEDLGIKKNDVSRDRLAARSVHDLVRWSGGLYQPASRFRNW
jgi:malonate decarboxylase alpha subunit